jgi:flagellar biosynthesis protein FliQ
MLCAYRRLRVTNICTANIAFAVAIFVLLLSAIGDINEHTLTANVTFVVAVLVLVTIRAIGLFKLCFAFVANVVTVCVNVICAGVTTPSPQTTRCESHHKHASYDKKR